MILPYAHSHAVRTPAAPAERFRQDVLRGLRLPDKALPCKYFYDEAGSALFERICGLEEYYLTRTELAIMRAHAPEMAALVGPRCLLVEYGSGSSTKTRLLLDQLPDPAGYVPIDISGEHLAAAAQALAASYPGVEVLPLSADFTRPFDVPTPAKVPARRVVYFPGSTVGNFTPDEAVGLLRQTARRCGRRGGLLLGTDFKKDPHVLLAAYNDAAGVTAAFNLNLLTRINCELGADFPTHQFWHYAFYNPRQGRIEMHLVSRQDLRVRVAGQEVAFAEGESIRTEYSYKYTPANLRELADAAGFEVRHFWTDERRYFGVFYLTVR
jgi:dimethylhistidine N-methyltransferase